MLINEIRKKYLEFFKKKNHKLIESSSLISDDQTTLFTSSGMQPLVPYLIGKEHFLGKRLVNFQKCFRADDIEYVGDGRHTTFFEMLGNWSLGDYYKKEQLAWIFEFLVDEIGLDPNKLYVTVFKGDKKLGIERDDESAKIWQNLFQKKGVKTMVVDMTKQKEMGQGKIFFYDASKNWWSRSGIPENMVIGDIGGSDSEIFYDFGDLKLHQKSKWVDQPCHVNCDCGRFIEIGNSVFIQYIRIETGFKRLKKKNVDFGGGLERIAMASQNKSNFVELDLFWDACLEIEKLSKKVFYDNKKFFEIIIDHLRAVIFILGDENGKIAIPNNKEQGYLIRRLIRRSIRSSKSLQLESSALLKIVLIIIENYKDIYPLLEKNKNFILTEIEQEIIKFDKTLEKGLQELDKILKLNPLKINGVDAFNLYQTYGFPIEMIQEIANEKKISFDSKEFQKALKKHQSLSKVDKNIFKGGLVDANKKEVIKLHTTTHILQAALKKILGKEISQKGSNITTERLRFDFNYSEKLTEKQKNQIENLINFWIQKGATVKLKEMTIKEAKKLGAIGVFDSYDETVKVYTIILEDGEVISREICGGPHIENIKELGFFKIKKEQSASRGIRRIKAILER